MNLSATQLETADLCIRKWRFTYHDRLPVYKKGHFGFGTCLHAVAERFLRSEANLYPEGWDIDPDSKVRLSPAEAAIIPVLIQAGIDAGYLERRPGGVVEAAFNLAANGHILRGKIDYHTVQGRRIEDHKTAKNDRYIKKTGKALAKNIQMQSYAKVLLEEVRSRGEVDPPFITLAHNQFLIEDEAVRRTEGEVTTAEVEAFWKGTILPLIDKIVAAAAAADTLELPMPEASACNAYGGCPFMSVCAGQESVLTYKARVSNMISSRPTTETPTAMSNSALDKLLKRTAPATASVNPPAPQVSTAAAAAAPATTAAPVPTQLPPWHSTKCPKCSPSGVNCRTPGFSKEDGSPCRICCSMTQVKARDLYEWGVESDGTVRWWKKGQKDQTVASTPPVEVSNAGSKTSYGIDALRRALQEATTTEATIALIDEATAALGDSPELALFLQAIDLKLEQLETPAPAAVEPKPTPAPAADTAEQAEEKKKRTRRTKAEMEAARAAEAAEAAAPAEPTPAPQEQRQGFILMCNCTTLSRGYPGMTVVLAEELLAELPGYWDKNAFERREGLQKLDWAMRLAGCVVLASGRNPDVDALVAALKPIAAITAMSTTG